MQAPAKRPIELEDIVAWKSIGPTALSNDGQWFAYRVGPSEGDAQDKVGNGIQLRDMSRGTVTVLDSGAASYERPTWTEKGDALAVLKGADDKALRDKLYAVVGFTGFGPGTPQKTSFDPASDRVFRPA